MSTLRSRGLTVLRERWWLALLAVVICVGGAGAYGALRPAQYTATLQTYVSAQAIGGDNAQQAYLGAQLSAERVKSYTQFATSDTVLDQVVQQLALPMTSEQLAGKVSATGTVDSVIIDIAVTDPSPERASAIANSVGSNLTALVEQLEKPAGNQPAPVLLKIVRPAPVPDSPSGTGLATLLAYGLVAGLFIGVGLILLADGLDNRVKSAEQMQRTAGAPLLGVVVDDSALRERGLLTLNRPGSPIGEAFRQIRTNLQFIAVENRSKVLLVTSSLAAEGKTTTLLNLAQTIASAGSRVLVIDGDLRRPQVAPLTSTDSSVGLASILSARAELAMAVQRGTASFDVITSGPVPPNPSELLGSSLMQRALDEARQRYDVVLVDTPPVLPVTDAAALAPLTDGVVLLCRHARTTQQQLGQAASALRSGGAELVGCVLTMASVKSSGLGYGAYSSAYASINEPASDRALYVPGPGRVGMPVQGNNGRDRSAVAAAPSPSPRSPAHRSAER